uniref:Uncharacterized protein n=1 Tax=Corvus moneduloides TaxID=1196302 RepID=A0A8U7P6D8_CORMO
MGTGRDWGYWDGHWGYWDWGTGSVRSLVRDLRRVLEPDTARNLQVRRSNSLRDLVAVAGPLGVSQFLVLSKSQTGINLKIFRLPGGPTLTFKVLQYSLVRDVVSALRRHRMHEQQFRHPPLLVLGNFGTPQIHVKLTAGMFQGMFPALNVHRVNLNSIRRCVLVSYDADSQLLEFRHYSIKVVPVGLSRGLRKLLQEKFPDLSRADDVSELLTGGVALSESEAEPDGTQNVLELPQNCAGRGNAVTQQSAVRLTEIGPRLTLQLVKVEEGLGQGNVLYHGLGEGHTWDGEGHTWDGRGDTPEMERDTPGMGGTHLGWRGTHLGWRGHTWDGEGTHLGWRGHTWDGGDTPGMGGTHLGWRGHTWDREGHTWDGGNTPGMERDTPGIEGDTPGTGERGTHLGQGREGHTWDRREGHTWDRGERDTPGIERDTPGIEGDTPGMGEGTHLG